MSFEDGASVKNYKYRLLLMMDEFTAIGKLEIFEKALAFMAGYGLKCFIIVQDLTQLEQAYGKEQSIVSNCHIRIAYAPNKIETANTLSSMCGETTIVQKKRSRSGTGMKANVSDSITETKRPLLTPSECMQLPGLEKSGNTVKKAGAMLVLPAGFSPIYGEQVLYFQDKELLERAKMPPPEVVSSTGETIQPTQAKEI
jgi:type IV secretion system protein VirD4